jgi:uncharacterized protein (DUF58 family)
MINHQSVQSYSHLELLAKHVVEGFITGLHKSPFHGFSVEFAEHRLYNSGESTKHIDWKLYGRTEKLFIKKYEEETNLRCQIVIDNSSSMYFPEATVSKEKPYNKISFSAYCSAAFVYLLRMQRDAVGLSIFADDLQLHTQSKSSIVHQKMIFNELDNLFLKYNPEHKTKTATAKALHTIAESIHKRSLVVIFSDMFDDELHNDDMFNALQHLKHNKHEVILFHVNDKKKEMDFDYENRPYEFIDMESGDTVKLNPSQVKEKYVESLNTYYDKLKLKCHQFAIDYVDADINMNINQILQPYFVKRSKML